MRELTDRDRLHRFMEAIGREARETTRLYLTGGATAVLYGWRETTIDVDVKLVPESDEILRAIPRLKESLNINVEMASPLDFIPVPGGWEERSPFITQERNAFFHHFDLYGQALAKVERGHSQDELDVSKMLERGLIDANRAWEYFERLKPDLYRYPSIDPASFERAAAKTFRGVR